jgi:hypothetical protein
LEQMVATHSVVLKKIGGKRAGELGVGSLLASEKVAVHGLLAPQVASTAAAVRGLAIMCAEIWTCDAALAVDRHLRAFADKGSARWLRGAQAAADRLASAASVVVGDRESDINEVVAGKPAAADLIIVMAAQRQSTKSLPR